MIYAIKPDIEAALRHGVKAAAQSISVDVQDGEVRLSDAVHGWSEHALATHSAWNTPGVLNVVDNLHVIR